jgi:hypothetical protein
LQEPSISGIICMPPHLTPVRRSTGREDNHTWY